jgi:Flp pilus assembly protein TadD
MLAARTYAATGDMATAEQYLRRVISKDASYLQAYSALGQLYLRQRRLDAALAEFDALAAKDPKPVAALTLAGMILQAQGKNGGARAKFERVMQIDASAPVAANNLAWMLAESGGDLNVALQLAQTAQRGLPDSPEVINTVGFVYYKKGLYSSAIPALKKSAELAPSNPMYHLHLGLAYAKSGDMALARKAMQQALDLKPDGSSTPEGRELTDLMKLSEQ